MISYWITNCLINAAIIEAEDRNIYEYSIKSLLGNILNIVSCILIGILCGEIIRVLVFLLIMIPLRSTIGGCHLNSPFLCFLASCGIVFVCILAPEYLYNIPIIIYTLSTFKMVNIKKHMNSLAGNSVASGYSAVNKDVRLSSGN